MEGPVVWYNAVRGYGFIEPAHGGGDVVFSRAALASTFDAEGPRHGNSVCYEVADGEQGPEAIDVKPAG